MKLLAIIVVFLLIQRGADLGPLQRDHWFGAWCQAATRRLGGSLPVAIGVVVLPALLAHVLVQGVSWLLFGLLQFVGLVLVLAYSLGRGDFSRTVDDYLGHWARGDLQGAYHVAGRFQAEAADPLDAVDAAGLHRFAVQALLYQGFQRWFAVLFWFVLLGPLGALAYGGLQLAGNAPDRWPADTRATLGRLLQWLEWPAVQVLAFSFSLIGDFSSCSREWSRSMPAERGSDRLARFALAALGEGAGYACQGTAAIDDESLRRGVRQLEDLVTLQRRSLLLWLVMLSLLVLLLGL